MDFTVLERWEPLAGALAAVFLIAGSLVSGMDGYMIPAESLAARAEAHKLRILAGIYLSLTATFLLIWFGDNLRQTLNGYEGVGARLSLVVFAGMASFAVVMAVGLGIRGAAVERGGISPETLAVFSDANNMMMGKVAPVVLAVVTLGTGIAALQTPIFPAWFGWVSFVVTLGLLSPINFYFIILGLAWIVTTSVWMFVN